MSDLFEGPPQPIKALSLWQPWASLKARGLKRHETRHWSTDYRGPIAIHAAKTLDVAGAPDVLCLSAFGQFWHRELPLGAIVAIGQLAAVVPAEGLADNLTRADRAAGNFAAGRFAWRVEQLRPLKTPIPCVGRQGLFNWTPPADVEDRLGEIRDHAAICFQLGWA